MRWREEAIDGSRSELERQGFRKALACGTRDHFNHLHSCPHFLTYHRSHCDNHDPFCTVISHLQWSPWHVWLAVVNPISLKCRVADSHPRLQETFINSEASIHSVAPKNQSYLLFELIASVPVRGGWGLRFWILRYVETSLVSVSAYASNL